MDAVKAYQQKKLTAGWTRIEMLLVVYEKAITEIDACAYAAKTDDFSALTRHELNARKAFLAIHAGLKPESCEIAFNVARLLHFVLTSFDQRDFETAKAVLEQIRDAFQSIETQANELEFAGEIQPVPEHDSFHSIV